MTKTIRFQSLYQVIGRPNLLKKTFDELKEVLDIRSQKGIELHVRDVRKRGYQIKTGDNE